jgi:2-oxoglutarate ferredoxin oxidoreductase subunit alpha
MSEQIRFIQGNEVCVEASLYAGLEFYAGYPITPSTEVAELMSSRLPQIGGKFIQMEDEIASMAAVVGASLTGVKAMTATSGPGFSLKQENIGYACMAEVPVVVVSIMRMGPSTGLPTSPAQGDLMQARWGTHGDHPAICLVPTSVKEMYDFTVRAFNLAEKYRTPVMLMTDEVIAHMREGVTLDEHYEVVDRKRPAVGDESYLPYADVDGDGIPPMAAYGDGFHFHVTGLSHDETGFPTNSPEKNEKLLKRIMYKVDKDADQIATFSEYMTEDAEYLLVALGSVARTALNIARQLREQGVKAGVFVPKTMWPFPEKALKQRLGAAKMVIVPELNLGQLVLETERIVAGACPVKLIAKASGELFKAEELYENVMAVIKE